MIFGALTDCTVDNFLMTLNLFERFWLVTRGNHQTEESCLREILERRRQPEAIAKPKVQSKTLEADGTGCEAPTEEVDSCPSLVGQRESGNNGGDGTISF